MKQTNSTRCPAQKWKPIRSGERAAENALLRNKMLATSSVVEGCLFSISRFFLVAGVYFYPERIKVFTPLLERKELICRLATPPTPAEAGSERKGGK